MIDKIAQKVCENVCISIEELKSKSQNREISVAKQMFIKLALDKTLNKRAVYKYLNMTESNLNHQLGRFSDMYSTDKLYRELYNRIGNDIIR